ncbi:MAG: AraC family transcriptional regulator [Clostridiales bacterium]|nr:AraC family transcriptional regulator [Clostridiales bacterium]
MDRHLYDELKKITSEEKQILSGNARVDRELYSTGNTDGDIHTVEARKLLEAGKLIELRKHTRFVHFPRHTHDYVEMIYMCSGSTRQRINGHDVVLSEGELLLLNQKAEHEIFPAGEDDIAVNFIILPEFFDQVLRMMTDEANALRDFVIDCLQSDCAGAGYMHFKVAQILPVQNLVENLIWSIHNHQPNRRSMNQMTMGLLFLQLMNHMDRMETDAVGEEQLVISVLRYIEEHYRDGELTELAQILHYDISWLSREIRRQTGRTYTELVQEKRLNQAAYLLAHTAMSVMDVGMAVGYENQSYFHRIFQKQFQMTPRNYRMKARESTPTS